jgi:hypothetical protein
MRRALWLLATLLALSAGQAVGEPRGEGQAPQPHHAAYQPPADAKWYRSPDRADCEYPKSGEDETLCIGRRAAKASEDQAVQATAANSWAARQYRLAWLQIGLNALALVGLGYTVYYAAHAWEEGQRSAKEAQEANRINRQALVADHRAWLEIAGVEIETDLTWKDGEARMTVWFAYKNIGKTPARAATTEAVLHFDFLRWPHEVRKEMMAINAGVPPFFGQLVFPDRELRQGLGLVISKVELDEYDLRMKVAFGDDRAPREFDPLRLVGCVTYWSAGPDPQQTGFVFDIEPVAPFGVGQSFKRGQDVPKTHMILRRTHMGDIETT